MTTLAPTKDESGQRVEYSAPVVNLHQDADGFALEVAEAARALHPSVTLFGECINEIHAELEAEKRKRKAGLIYLKEKVNRVFARLNV